MLVGKYQVWWEIDIYYVNLKYGAHLACNHVKHVWTRHVGSNIGTTGEGVFTKIAW